MQEYREKAFQLGNKLEEIVNKVADAYMFYNELDDIDQSHIDDVSSDDNGQDLTWVTFIIFRLVHTKIVLVIMTSETIDLGNRNHGI